MSDNSPTPKRKRVESLAGSLTSMAPVPVIMTDNSHQPLVLGVLQALHASAPPGTLQAVLEKFAEQHPGTIRLRDEATIQHHQRMKDEVESKLQATVSSMEQLQHRTKELEMPPAKRFSVAVATLRDQQAESTAVANAWFTIIKHHRWATMLLSPALREGLSPSLNSDSDWKFEHESIKSNLEDWKNSLEISGPIPHGNLLGFCHDVPCSAGPDGASILEPIQPQSLVQAWVQESIDSLKFNTASTEYSVGTIQLHLARLYSEVSRKLPIHSIISHVILDVRNTGRDSNTTKPKLFVDPTEAKRWIDDLEARYAEQLLDNPSTPIIGILRIPASSHLKAYECAYRLRAGEMSFELYDWPGTLTSRARLRDLLLPLVDFLGQSTGQDRAHYFNTSCWNYTNLCLINISSTTPGARLLPFSGAIAIQHLEAMTLAEFGSGPSRKSMIVDQFKELDESQCQRLVTYQTHQMIKLYHRTVSVYKACRGVDNPESTSA